MLNMQWWFDVSHVYRLGEIGWTDRQTGQMLEAMTIPHRPSMAEGWKAHYSICNYNPKCYHWTSPGLKFSRTYHNENLNWKSHCDKIANNISRAVGVLNRLKHFLPEPIRILLYNSMIVSHINYCILVWGGYEYLRIFKLQKKDIRIISISKYNAHSGPLFKHLNLLQIEDIWRLNELKFYYKYENRLLPDYFKRRKE